MGSAKAVSSAGSQIKEVAMDCPCREDRPKCAIWGAGRFALRPIEISDSGRSRFDYIGKIINLFRKVRQDTHLHQVAETEVIVQAVHLPILHQPLAAMNRLCPH
ncbi:hypothetical protein BDV12DRAFT_166842 [Aspergillus spectabilis]